MRGVKYNRIRICEFEIYFRASYVVEYLKLNLKLMHILHRSCICLFIENMNSAHPKKPFALTAKRKNGPTVNIVKFRIFAHENEGIKRSTKTHNFPQ